MDPTVPETTTAAGHAPSSATESRSGVTAVVLTYRRPRLATRVVRNLMDAEGLAPDRILVVVNGEGGLVDSSLERKVRLLRLRRNLGPAGGFRAGLEAAFEDTTTRFAYLCEDDVTLFDLPDGRLDRVVAAVEDRGADRVGAVVAYGRRLTGRSGATLVYTPPSPDDGLHPVDVAAWGATLVTRAVINAGVLPDPELFFGYEDFDFFFKVRKAGLEVLVDAVTARAVAGQMTLAGRDAALSEERPVDSAEAWRAYYVARNFFEVARRHGEARWLAWHLLYSVRRMQLARSNAERIATLEGLRDGWRRRLGQNERFVRTTGEWEREPR